MIGRALLATVLAVWPVLAQPIRLKTTTLLDGQGHVLKNKDVLIAGSRIQAIVDSISAATYDLTGLTVLPGFIDTHVHLGWHFNKDNRLDAGGAGSSETPQEAALYAEANAYATLMGGFTTVQSLGSPIDVPLRNLIQAGTIPGPRVLTSWNSINEKTGTPEEICIYARKMKAEGADVIKLFATRSIRDGGAQSMTDAQIQAACGEAKSLGLRAAVHAHASDGAVAAINAGCTSIEHGTFLDDRTFERMAAKGVYFDPNFLVLLKKAEAHHVKIVLGTDAVAGSHGRNAEEFIYRVKDAGQDPMEALVSGTSLAAESLGLAGETGSVAPGLAADIVAIEGNPLDDITAVRRVVFVMKDGKVYKNVAHK